MRRSLFPFLALTISLTSPCWGLEDGSAVVRSGTFSKDLYVTGGSVLVDARVAGDVVAAGGVVEIGDGVEGDILAGAGTLKVKGRVGDDLRAAAGILDLQAVLGGDALLAGGTVRMSPSSRVEGHAWLACGKAEVLGGVEGELAIVAETVLLGGQVGGPVRIAARDIRVLPGAVIGGDLSYQSLNPAVIEEGAVVKGKVTHLKPDVRETVAGARRAVVTAFSVLFALSLAVTGFILIVVFRRFTLEAARAAVRDPWKSLGLGFALLLCLPAGAVFFMITALGIPVGIMLLCLYPVLLLSGFLVGVTALGDLIARSVSRGKEPSLPVRMAFFATALLALMVLGRIPWAGGLILFLVLLMGMGALTLRLFGHGAPTSRP